MKKYRFALMSFVFVALAAYALSPATQWGDVLPTNTLAEVADGAGLATTNALAGKLDADSGTMTGTFNLNGRLNVNYSGGTAYEIDYYGIRMRYSGGVTKQIYMPSLASFADGGYMALVDNLAPSFSTSTTYYKGDFVRLYGLLYICTATSHTGTWSASDFAVATVQDALASKLGHEGPWVNGYIDVLERNVGESVPYGVRIYRDKIVFGAFTNTVPRGFTPIREFALPSAGGTLALTDDIATAITNNLGLSNNCVKIGIGADTVDAANAVAVGLNTYAQYNAVAVGSTAKSVAGEGVAVGPDTTASEWGAVAIGKGATASSAYAVQIGAGNNTSNNSFKVFNTMLLDADGHVPLLTGKTYDLSTSAGITNALADIITALGGAVQ